jgi:hypothetical protein
MTRTALFAALFTAAVLAGVQADVASGAVWCNAHDETLTFALRAGLTNGPSGGFLNFTADLRVKLANVPNDFRTLHFSEAAVNQRWLDNKEFKLRLYRARNKGPSGDLVLVILTSAAEEGQYRGRYLLTVNAARSADGNRSQTWEKSGGVACAAE